jgi:membrane fusion protein (multidrug efflux system)
MNVNVDVKDTNAASLTAVDPRSTYKTDVFAKYGDEANDAIAHIIAANE